MNAQRNQNNWTPVQYPSQPDVTDQSNVSVSPTSFPAAAHDSSQQKQSPVVDKLFTGESGTQSTSRVGAFELSAEDWKQLDKQMYSAAQKGLQSFIEEVFTEASNWVQRFANVALMSGLAAGALTPVLEQGEDGIRWLTGNHYLALAEWAISARSEQVTSKEVDPVALAEHLDRYIQGQPEKINERLLPPRNAHSKAGEEVVRLLRSLDVSGALRKALKKQETHNRVLISTFSQELNRLLQRQFANTYMYNYTIQEAATQGFLLLADEVKLGRGLSKELAELRTKLSQLLERPSFVIVDKIQTDGGMVNLGIIQTNGGAVSGRDVQVAFNCP